jgi:hypothetical protein
VKWPEWLQLMQVWLEVGPTVSGACRRDMGGGGGRALDAAY